MLIGSDQILNQQLSPICNSSVKDSRSLKTIIRNLPDILFISVLLLLVTACGIFRSSEEHMFLIERVSLFDFDDKFPAPRPGFNEIVFVRYDGGVGIDSLIFGLYLVDIDSGNQRVLAEGIFGEPAWLDSNTIIVPSNNVNSNGLLRYDLLTNTAELVSSADAKHPTVRHYNGTVAFENGSKIWSLNLSTKEVTQLSKSGGFATPSWSPNGEVLAVSQDALSGTAAIIIAMTPSGDIQTTYTVTKKNYRGYFPYWDGLGKKIVFDLGQPNEENQYIHKIVIHDLQNSQSSIVTEGRYPAFETNNQWIVYSCYTSVEGSGLRIHRFNMITETKVQITF